MVVTMRCEDSYYEITAVVTNRVRTGALNQERVDDLWRLALLSEIAWHENTIQRLGGDVHGAWLRIMCGHQRVVAENVLAQAEAAGFEVERVEAA